MQRAAGRSDRAQSIGHGEVSMSYGLCGKDGRADTPSATTRNGRARRPFAAAGGTSEKRVGGYAGNHGGLPLSSVGLGGIAMMSNGFVT